MTRSSDACFASLRDCPTTLDRVERGYRVGGLPAKIRIAGPRLATALADLDERVSRPVVLIVGMLASKDCEGFLRNFSGLARRVIAIPIPH